MIIRDKPSIVCRLPRGGSNGEAPEGSLLLYDGRGATVQKSTRPCRRCLIGVTNYYTVGVTKYYTKEEKQKSFLGPGEWIFQEILMTGLRPIREEMPCPF